MPTRLTALTDPGRGAGDHRLVWPASDETGTPVGSAFLRIFTRKDQDHLAELEIHVHPAVRRKGTGSQLLDAVARAAGEHGRRSVVVQTEAGTPGDLLHTVAAVDEADGPIAGFTELVVPSDGQGDGQHYGTGVLPGHRGHGLARWTKAAAILGARERHPDLGGLLADTADSNTYMRAISDAFGYEPTHRSFAYQPDL